VWQKQAPGFTQPGAFFFALIMTARRVDDQSAEWLEPDRLDTLLLHVDDHEVSTRFALP
jgi:hypothetical protein